MVNCIKERYLIIMEDGNMVKMSGFKNEISSWDAGIIDIVDMNTGKLFGGMDLQNKEIWNEIEIFNEKE